VAALVLKNVASTSLAKWPPEVLEFVKQNIIVAHNDTSVLVRNAAGQVVVAMLDALGPANWPDCLNHLITNLDASEIDKQLVSVFAFNIVNPPFEEKRNVFC
jgi:transportin-1